MNIGQTIEGQTAKLKIKTLSKENTNLGVHFEIIVHDVNLKQRHLSEYLIHE